MTRKFYAAKIVNGNEVDLKEIGTARMNYDRTISARKYNELKLNFLRLTKSEAAKPWL